MSALPVALLVMAQAASLNVALTLSPTLGEPGAPPTLKVALANTGTRRLDVFRFTDDACFAHFLLALSLTLPNGTTPPAVGCAVRKFPGAKGTLAPGARETRTLSLATLFPGLTWPAGRYGLRVEWKPSDVAATPAMTAGQQSRNADGFTLARPVGKARVERGKTVTFPDGARLEFTAHGHKRTMEGGPPSPLIVHGAFAAPGQPSLTPFEVSVHTEETRVFRVAGYALVLLAHEYDGWMELAAYGPLPGD